MTDIIGEVLLLVAAAVAVAVGLSGIRDIRRGEAQSLQRLSTRVYRRSEEPLGFWITVAAEMIWLILGLFILGLTLGGMLGMF